MPIPVTCRSCRRQFNAPDAAAGKKAKCPNCGDIIEIPAAAAPEEILDAEEEVRPQSTHEGLAVAPPLPDAVDDDLRPCPMCGEMIQKVAVKCRYCGEVFDPLLRKSEQQSKSASFPDENMTTIDWVIAIICSGIGCFVGIMWMIQGKPKGKKMILVSIIANFVWGGLSALMQSLATHSHR